MHGNETDTIRNMTPLELRGHQIAYRQLGRFDWKVLEKNKYLVRFDNIRFHPYSTFDLSDPRIN